MQTRIAIKHDGVKRWIEYPFSLCGESEVLRDIAQQIIRALDERGNGYGWVEITEHTDPVINSEPIGWKEQG